MKLIQISAAISLDGHIDDLSNNRLILSSPEDLMDMKAARAECDAVLVGANTIRKDDPSLLCGSMEFIEKRVGHGRTPEPIKVTITETGHLDSTCKFFSKGNAQKIVLCSEENFAGISEKLSAVAEIIAVKKIDAANIVKALENRGIQSLFVEGGTSVLTMFLSEGIFHKLRLAIAPFFIGDNKAPYLVANSIFKNDTENRLRITGIRNLGNMAVLDITNEGYRDG